MNVAAAVREAATLLAQASDTPRLDAELLMAHALNVSRSELLLRHLQQPVPERFASLLARRLADEPVAYILGEQEFFGLTFRVNRAVLIPRGDSETVVAAALAARPQARSVLDCGTGSGALLLAVLSRLTDAQGIGIDRADDAIEVAVVNAALLQLDARARMMRADWSEPGWVDALPAPFDLILANPPYVEDSALLAPSVRGYEPPGALFAGADGLDAYRTLLPQLSRLLTSGGAAVIEIGATQLEAVVSIATAAGLDCRMHPDLAGRPRALEMSRSC